MKKGIDYIGVTVCFYCHDEKGNLLLNKRSANCRDEQGRWDCGGGALKFGESWEEGARREIKEEYGCDVIKLQQVGINNVLRKNEGKLTHWIAIVFAAQVDPKKVTINDKDKIDEIGWFKPDKLPQPLHSMYLTHLEFIKKTRLL